MEGPPESKQKDLTPPTAQQLLFCDEYLIDRNGTQAAIRAKYSPATAQEQASRLLSNVMVRAKINELIKEQHDKLTIDVTWILRQLLNSANVDIADAYDEDGKLKPISEMPEPLRKSICEVETEELFEGHGKEREQIGYTKKIKIEGRLKALNMLGKHLKMFTDVTEVQGLEELAEAIKAGRKRAAECRPQ